MKTKLQKVLFLIVALGLVFLLSGCDSPNGASSSSSSSSGGGGGCTTCPPKDSDGDGHPDATDCAILDPLKWQNVTVYPDADGDDVPNSYDGELMCIGNVAPTGYTEIPPPPVDNCPDDPLNLCHQTVCGDGACDSGETTANCGADCGCNNNNTCQPARNETTANCPNDCPPPACDYDGTCDAGENTTNCAADCGCNNNGTCQPARGETTATCPADCPSTTPTGVADDYMVKSGDTLIVPANQGVLANDTPAGGLTALRVTDPTNATLTLNADGSFTLRPNAGVTTGVITFTYKPVSGSVQGNTTTVTITVWQGQNITIPATLNLTARATLMENGQGCVMNYLVNDWPRMGDKVTNANTISVTCELNPNAVFDGWAGSFVMDFFFTPEVIIPGTSAAKTNVDPYGVDYIQGGTWTVGTFVTQFHPNVPIGGTVYYLDWDIVDNGYKAGNYEVYTGEGWTNQSLTGSPVNLMPILNVDSDQDDWPNPDDNCIVVANWDQTDSNNDGIGDACAGMDNDNDGWLNVDDFAPNNPAIW